MSESALIITDGDVENVPDERRSQPSSILEFLTTLTGAELTSLYRDPFTTMTVFRALPALARHVILRYLLLVNAAVPQSEAVRVLQSAVVSPLGGPALRRRLTDLNILQRRRTVPFAAVFAASSAQSEEPHVVLNPEFQQCLITALCGSGSGSGSASALVRSAISDGAPMTDLPTEQVPAEPLAPSSTPASASAPALTLSFASTSSAPSKPKSGSSILTLSLAPAPAASTATAPASVSTASGHAPDAAVESSSSAVAVHAAALPASTSSGLPAVTIPMLDAHADATWARLQLWLAGVGPAHQAPPAPVRSRLREMGLVAPQRRGPAAEAELMARLGGIADALRDKDLVVTPAGVAFLFKPRAAQVWSVVLAYMAAQQEQSERETAASAAAGSSSAGAGAGVVAAARDELLRLIFRLCFLEVGEEYSVSELTQGQRRVLRDLRDLGLIYQPSELSETFWPTRLATLLAGPTVGAGKSKAGGAVRAAAAAALREGGSATAAAAREAAAAVVAQLGASRGAGAGASGSASASPGTGDETGSKGGSGDGGEAEDDGFIIVETSFKVVAFTRSPLRLALLSIFVDLSFLLPNAAVGRVTRASVRRALLNGLTVADVAAWFARHAHPQVVRRALGAPDETGRLTGGTGVVVPDNVVKQMGLWADERARLTATDAALVSDFASSEEFSSWAAFCRSAGILLLEEWSTRTLVVTAKGLEKVKEEHARRAKMETAKSMAHTDAGSVGSHVA